MSCTHNGRYMAFNCNCWVCAQDDSAERSKIFWSKMRKVTFCYKQLLTISAARFKFSNENSQTRKSEKHDLL